MRAGSTEKRSHESDGERMNQWTCVICHSHSDIGELMCIAFHCIKILIPFPTSSYSILVCVFCALWHVCVFACLSILAVDVCCFICWLHDWLLVSLFDDSCARRWKTLLCSERKRYLAGNGPIELESCFGWETTEVGYHERIHWAVWLRYRSNHPWPKPRAIPQSLCSYLALQSCALKL